MPYTDIYCHALTNRFFLYQVTVLHSLQERCASRTEYIGRSQTAPGSRVENPIIKSWIILFLLSITEGHAVTLHVCRSNHLQCMLLSKLHLNLEGLLAIYVPMYYIYYRRSGMTSQAIVFASDTNLAISLAVLQLHDRTPNYIPNRTDVRFSTSVCIQNVNKPLLNFIYLSQFIKIRCPQSRLCSMEWYFEFNLIWVQFIYK